MGLLDLHSRLLDSEEFRTLIQEAAGIVNDTPLWQTSDNPNEPQPLTPAMLLTQRDGTGLSKRPDDNPIEPYTYGPSRFKRINFLSGRFREEWQQHYLMDIGSRRQKWISASRNACIGDLVLIKDKNLPRTRWNLGTITDRYYSKDGLVRSALVKPHRREDKSVTEKERKRPIHDLVLIKESTMDVETTSEAGPQGLINHVQETPVNSDKYQNCPRCHLDPRSGGMPYCNSLHAAMMKPVHKTVKKLKIVPLTKDERYAKQRLKDLSPQDRAEYYRKRNISTHNADAGPISCEDYIELYHTQRPAGAGLTII